jgi:hypothetical protein
LRASNTARMSQRLGFTIAAACFAFATIMFAIDEDWGLAATTFGLACAFVGIAQSRQHA